MILANGDCAIEVSQMTMAESAANLNRKNKGALCAALICVGLILLLGGGVRPACGIGLLGIAFSWAFGANKRIVHWLFLILGLSLLVVAFLDEYEWRKNKPDLISDYASEIETDKSLLQSDISLNANLY
jgi:hypothetical protein